MGTPGAGRNDIPNRLKRQFAIFHVLPPSAAAINGVFGTLMAGRFDEPTFGPQASLDRGRLPWGGAGSVVPPAEAAWRCCCCEN